MATYSEDVTPAPDLHPRIRGVLDLCVLAVLATTPTHGYEIARALAAAGIGEVKGGTLYPLLGRLERQGLVVAEWAPSPSGPPRKRYALTAAGVAHLAAEGTAWSDAAGRVDQLLVTANVQDPEEITR